MCGRFTIGMTRAQMQEQFPEMELPDHFEPRFNVAPGQDVSLIEPAGPRQFQSARWGWPAPSAGARRLINARAETLAQRPLFRDASPCLIPADGFYEWAAGPRQAFYFHLRDGAAFALAGLCRRQPDGALACVVVTTAANALVRPIHERMPVMLARDRMARWLAGAVDGLQPLEAARMARHPVSARVNSIRRDDPGCRAPAVPERELPLI